MFRLQILYLFIIVGLFSTESFARWPDIFSVRDMRAEPRNKGDKIVGGVNANIKTYPHQASLSIFDGNKYYYCGGTILSNTYVLTAAHCLVGMKKVFVRIGSKYLETGGQEYEATSAHVNALYSNKTNDYDVGIVKIKSKMVLDGINSKAVQLVKSGYKLEDGEKLVVTGWGRTEEHGSVSKTLMSVEIPTVSKSKCESELQTTITPRMICAGVPEGGKDACQGDSGGPVLVKATNQLVGITSFGEGCGRRKIPGVYTNVGNDAIRSYIRQIAKE